MPRIDEANHRTGLGRLYLQQPPLIAAIECSRRPRQRPSDEKANEPHGETKPTGES